jgi:hypothetical protein
VGFIVPGDERSGSIFIRRTGNTWEGWFLDVKKKERVLIAQYMLDLPAAVYLGVTANTILSDKPGGALRATIAKPIIAPVGPPPNGAKGGAK